MGGGAVEKEAQSVSSDSSDSGNPVVTACGTGKAVPPVNSTTANSTGHNNSTDIRGNNELPAAESESLAPAVIKGGENEFVKVSHLASIEVKEVTHKPPPRNLKRKNNTTDVASETTDMEETAEEGSRSLGRTRISRVSSPNVLDYLDDVSESAPMEVIEKSPYEQGLNAEKGEKIFQEIKRLLKEDTVSDDVRSVNPETVRIFGPTNGWCLVKANGLIDKSGMVFSQEWVNGNIRGNIVGKIPNHLLLLCLVPKRFIKAGELLLSGLCRDMEVYSIVNSALIDWRMDEDYKLISATTKNFNFSSRKRDCFKCAIFVARVYGCCLAFGIKKLDSRLMAKVKVCLDIMEDHLGDAASTRKRKTDGVVIGTSNVPISQLFPPEDDQSQPAKRKRGRPSNQQNSLLIEPAVGEDANKRGTDERKAESKEGSASGRNRRPIKPKAGSVKAATSAAPEQTFQQLMTRFEEKYEEMGQNYMEMGNLLSLMRVAVEERREKTEQQIRKEVLDEVQKSIFSSIPKK